MADNWTDGTETEGFYASPWTALPGVRTGNDLSRGERAADKMRHFMGSWGFVTGFVTFMLFWALINVPFVAHHVSGSPFDPYPFILLNLLLSTLAGLQGAILLIAAKRADAVAAEQALSHFTISSESRQILDNLSSEFHKVKEIQRTVDRLERTLNHLVETAHTPKG